MSHWVLMLCLIGQPTCIPMGVYHSAEECDEHLRDAPEGGETIEACVRVLSPEEVERLRPTPSEET